VRRVTRYIVAERVRRVGPYAVAVVAVLPLFVPAALSGLSDLSGWSGLSGFRLAASDPVLSVIATTEQPLSQRSPGGVWAMGLALLWFSLAYRHRRVGAWETGLVLVGGAAALIRLGNTWLDAAALVLPLARQFRLAQTPAARPVHLANPSEARTVRPADPPPGRPFLPADPPAARPVRLAEPPAARTGGPPALNTRRMRSVAVVAASLVAFGLTTVASLPPALPAPAADALVALPARGRVLADWRWAAEVQRRLGPTQPVLASAGLASESPAFWLSYLQVAQGHARWAADLRQLHVDLVVLESADQQHAAAELVRASPDWHVLFDASGAVIAERIRP
jgi:hypothetical protein